MTLVRCALYCYNALKVTSIVQQYIAHSFTMVHHAHHADLCALCTPAALNGLAMVT